jgi:hypothetical protein
MHIMLFSRVTVLFRNELLTPTCIGYIYFQRKKEELEDGSEYFLQNKFIWC